MYSTVDAIASAAVSWAGVSAFSSSQIPAMMGIAGAYLPDRTNTLARIHTRTQPSATELRSRTAAPRARLVPTQARVRSALEYNQSSSRKVRMVVCSSEEGSARVPRRAPR